MGAILPMLGKIGMSMLLSLLTESVLKKTIILALEKLAKRTATDIDDELLKVCKEAWQVEAK